MSGNTSHRREIIDQFTKQATAFAALPAHSNGEAMTLSLDLAGVAADDRVLDVACGPGIMACAMAQRAAHVTGIDLTAAMIDAARRRQAEMGLHNLEWRLGDGERLPFSDGAFTLVTSRYALHHMEDPVAMLREMRRVASREGRVLVIDATPEASTQEAYDAMEKLRDPSHVRALTPTQLIGMGRAAGLSVRAAGFYLLEMALEAQLRASSPLEGDRERIRALFQQDADSGADRLGMRARRGGDDIAFSYPISVLLFGREDTRE